MLDTSRSINPDDYQAIPRNVAAMAKSFAAGSATHPHTHARDQLLYAVEGVMRVTTRDAAWIVPPDRALYMPGGEVHGVAMRRRVEMRTLYIEPTAAPGLPQKPVVLEVSDLLRALILQLLEEPVLYDEAGRGGLIAALVLDEISRARSLALVIPMPRDKRLKRLCERLLIEPARNETLERLAEGSGASARTLSRLFLAETGLTFSQWRQRVRFTSALEALVRGVPVGEVARAIGYASPSAFSAAFRKVLGQTPGSLSGGTAPPR
ncbi:MAG: helix-turn-helix transcriptional regulator [Hyphomicrobiales bacterium]|nr:helix-turn-helix transcriptional regulator [Hyphomicrobiales bacterium]